MRNPFIAVLPLALVMPLTSTAQSSFDGTWKVDFQAGMPTKVNVWLLKDGIYKCTSCSPTIEVKADGRDQPVKGQAYDTISVRVVDRQTVKEIEKKNGQTVSDEKFTVSHDGNTVTDEFGNWKLTMNRIAVAPTGAHTLSGSWKPSKIESVSNKELLVTYKLEGDTLSMSRPTGQFYAARLDGMDARYEGDPDINGVTLRRIAERIIEETGKLNGKVVSVTRLIVGLDGKSMTVAVKDMQDGTTNEFTMRKQ